MRAKRYRSGRRRSAKARAASMPQTAPAELQNQFGMFPPRPGDKPGTLRVSSTGRFSQLADEARQLSLEEVQPGDEERVFYKLPVHQKVIVMLGGPTMNFLIAVVLLWAGPKPYRESLDYLARWTESHG